MWALSLVARRRGYSLVGEGGLLPAVVSLAVEHELEGNQASAVVACGLSSGSQQAPDAGSIAVVHGLSCPMACGIFLGRDQTGIPHIAKWTLNHWTTREARLDSF